MPRTTACTAATELAYVASQPGQCILGSVFKSIAQENTTLLQSPSPRWSRWTLETQVPRLVGGHPPDNHSHLTTTCAPPAHILPVAELPLLLHPLQPWEGLGPTTLMCRKLFSQSVLCALDGMEATWPGDWHWPHSLHDRTTAHLLEQSVAPRASPGSCLARSTVAPVR